MKNVSEVFLNTSNEIYYCAIFNNKNILKCLPDMIISVPFGSENFNNSIW